jgi:deazaflavin-dependent oxidoreductase (nitroreductase family)
MSILNQYHAHLRWLYRGGRPHLLAGLLNNFSARVFGAGIWPRRLAALDVRGRKSGRQISIPVVIAEHEGQRYLVSMLGENANWVKNVRADQGRAVLRHGRSESVRLVDVPADERAPILRAYLAVAPGARPHISVDQHAPLHEIEKVAQGIPVFRIVAMR